MNKRKDPDFVIIRNPDGMLSCLNNPKDKPDRMKLNVENDESEATVEVKDWKKIKSKKELDKYAKEVYNVDLDGRRSFKEMKADLEEALEPTEEEPEEPEGEEEVPEEPAE